MKDRTKRNLWYAARVFFGVLGVYYLGLVVLTIAGAIH